MPRGAVERRLRGGICGSGANLTFRVVLVVVGKDEVDPVCVLVDDGGVSEIEFLGIRVSESVKGLGDDGSDDVDAEGCPV